jgi:DNA invertase Pin-like site-specific DNA recombinase
MSKIINETSTRAPANYAYVRINSDSQNTDRQLIALEPYNIPPANLFIEIQSGRDFKRPQYKRMVRKMKDGDILHIKSVDRLGRSYLEVIGQWRFLTRKKGVDIKVLDMPILDTTYCKDLLGTFVSDLILSVMSLYSQLERENILQRQAEGIAAAKAKGVIFGRKPVALPDNFDEIFHRWRDKELSNEEAAALCECSVRTLYNLTAELRALEF